MFYQNLINAPDVPRDYKSRTDDSDQMFFKAFVKDIKYLARIINFRKRIFGIEDYDTIVGIEKDFDQKTYPGTVEQLDKELLVQIDYLFQLITKKGLSLSL